MAAVYPSTLSKSVIDMASRPPSGFRQTGFYIIGGSQSLRRGPTAYRYGSTYVLL